MRSLLLGLTSESIIVRFHDIRDAIEYFFDLQQDSKAFLTFVSEAICPTLLELGWMEAAHPASLQLPTKSILSPDNLGCIALTLYLQEDPHDCIPPILVIDGCKIFIYI